MSNEESPGSRTMSVATPPRPLGVRHRLVVLNQGGKQTALLPERGEVIVGRTRESDVRIESTAVSRRHARISIVPGTVVISDLRSHNGIWINGERLTADRLLSYGDIITFGDVTAVFESAEDPRPETRDEAVSVEPGVLELGGLSVVIEDPAMRHVYLQLERLASSDLPVLIIGETGTGKELAARALCFWSKRSDKPLVSINCAALPDALAESELFGYERGAFTGAATAKLGLFESAPAGTVFLDEIGDLSLTVQAKLLRALENRTIMLLGSVRERPIDVRVVSATNRNLSGDVRAGRFRQDLYYRLTAGIIHLPALRARPGELPVLARRFLEEACNRLGRPKLGIPEATMALLHAHPWPGNVRELKNFMECVAALADGSEVTTELADQQLRIMSGVAQAASLAASAASTASAPSVQSLGEATRVFERAKIEAALASTRGNKTRAAKLLGVPLRTFMDKIKRHGLG